MQKGIVRRRGSQQVAGVWRADARSIVVETEDPDLRKAVDEVLGTSQTIPVHPPEHFDYAAQAEPMTDSPSRIKYLALFALELEERGFELEPEED